MDAITGAATEFPAFLFTVALIVLAGFWLLVAVGAADAYAFDQDVDAAAWGLGGVPVAVSLSLFTGLSWSGALGAGLLLDPAVRPGPAHAVTDLAVFVTAPAAAWPATRLLVRPWRRPHPAGTGPTR
ncbi:hypothetical protein ACFWNK_17345 [Streptomyces sp. NPDC058417]|uniref:hypothetical protein n=1 Tax=unclassified Streptomyces TaxID=2593676 RepID=UPI0036520A24